MKLLPRCDAILKIFMVADRTGSKGSSFSCDAHCTHPQRLDFVLIKTSFRRGNSATTFFSFEFNPVSDDAELCAHSWSSLWQLALSCLHDHLETCRFRHLYTPRTRQLRPLPVRTC